MQSNRLLSVDKAIDLVRNNLAPLPAKSVDLLAARGLVLATDIQSDVDSPPHDKALMDGYAVRAIDCRPDVGLQVVEEIVAGGLPRLPIGCGQTSRIMTGAPIPSGADAVVPIEETKSRADAIVVRSQRVASGQHILPRATVMQQGDTVLHRGRVIRSVDVGLLAEVGALQVPVVPQISVGNFGDRRRIGCL